MTTHLHKPLLSLTAYVAFALLFLAFPGCSRPPSPAAGPQGPLIKVEVIPGRWTLVGFGAPWCAICEKMKPELARFKAEQPNVTLASVNVEDRESASHKAYFKEYFKGRAVPFTVLVDSSGKAVKAWSGHLPYDQLAGQILEIAEHQQEGAPHP